MIDVSDECAMMLDNLTFVMSCRASITLAGAVLLDDIPVITGTEEFDDALRVPERVVITVPRVVDGVDLTPTEATDPLAPYGQRLHIKIGIGLGQRTEWLDRGEFLIERVELSGTDIQVTAVGLLALIDEARLVGPFQPTGTLLTALRTLIEPALTVRVDSSVTALDRAVPASLNDDEDRLGAALDVLTAWPARAQVTPSGYLQVWPDDYYPPSTFLQRYNFTEDDVAQNYANILELGGALTRDGLYNAVVARGLAADGNTVAAAAYDRTPGGPTEFRGPFNPLPVPFFYYSPLITTAVQAQSAANGILARRAARSADRIKMTCVPDPRIVGNDLVQYRAERSTDVDREIPCVVEHLSLPYTADSGPMTVVLREYVDE